MAGLRVVRRLARGGLHPSKYQIKRDFLARFCLQPVRLQPADAFACVWA
eukprot:CAMPEP_0115588660 /NCGR_PEP_ID=MMETSP0272-20121206/8833_1 /TAXON_ID=71861 /ORGANISM="Scrippsiella trochoidea, Strain CCMP3099" /LENGTH=48 /DNA_ID= /DNA_START= /DNA_END= /DNA_ORIENTATION=